MRNIEVLEIAGVVKKNVPVDTPEDIDALVAMGMPREDAEALSVSHKEAVAKEEALTKAKHEGEEYADTGVNVPFRSSDAVGLLQVKAAFEMGAQSTTMVFSNGSKLPLTPETFPAFAAWFTQKRNSFFQDT